MDLRYYIDSFPINLPIGDGTKFWNGRPDEYSNLRYGLEFSQPYGLTTYAKTGVYGRNADGTPKDHNGHDYAGVTGTPGVAPTKVFTTFKAYSDEPKGADPRGYGNYLFFETETKVINGESIKVEYVLAHCSKITATTNRWYNPGAELVQMGSTGMSTGPHYHFGLRPLIKRGNDFEWLVQENRGYVDPMPFLIVKPVFDKQILIDQLKDIMKLIKKKGTTDVYAIDKAGTANLIQNWDTYQRGILMGLWEDNVQDVDVLPKTTNIIILTSNN